jgi:hypothetical protein
MIAVHGVLDGVARDENIAVELRHRRIRDDEAIAIVVKNQTSFDLRAIHERRGLSRADRALERSFARSRLFQFAVREAVPSAGQFLNGATLPERCKHLEERPIVGFLEMETLRDFIRGRGLASNLQKTQYVIGTKV